MRILITMRMAVNQTWKEVFKKTIIIRSRINILRPHKFTKRKPASLPRHSLSDTLKKLLGLET